MSNQDPKSNPDPNPDSQPGPDDDTPRTRPPVAPQHGAAGAAADLPSGKAQERRRRVDQAEHLETEADSASGGGRDRPQGAYGDVPEPGGTKRVNRDG